MGNEACAGEDAPLLLHAYSSVPAPLPVAPPSAAAAADDASTTPAALAVQSGAKPMHPAGVPWGTTASLLLAGARFARGCERRPSLHTRRHHLKPSASPPPHPPPRRQRHVWDRGARAALGVFETGLARQLPAAGAAGNGLRVPGGAVQPPRRGSAQRCNDGRDRLRCAGCHGPPPRVCSLVRGRGRSPLGAPHHLHAGAAAGEASTAACGWGGPGARWWSLQCHSSAHIGRCRCLQVLPGLSTLLASAAIACLMLPLAQIQVGAAAAAGGTCGEWLRPSLRNARLRI